jgi:crossover junction endodeoxyribonuclease RuvC
MRVLGVDPGLTRCGVGVVDSRPGRKAVLVAVGVIRTSADLSVDLRLLQVSEGIESWIEAQMPDVVAIERVFARRDVSTVMGTAQASGIAMVAAARRGIPVAMHTPSEVKAAVTGSGRAGKEQVQRMVASILSLAELPKPADAADALALAICHLWRPAGALQGGDRHELTPAQRAWAAADHAARRRSG